MESTGKVSGDVDSNEQLKREYSGEEVNLDNDQERKEDLKAKQATDSIPMESVNNKRENGTKKSPRTDKVEDNEDFSSAEETKGSSSSISENFERDVDNTSKKLQDATDSEDEEDSLSSSSDEEESSQSVKMQGSGGGVDAEKPLSKPKETKKKDVDDDLDVEELAQKMKLKFKSVILSEKEVAALQNKPFMIEKTKERLRAEKEEERQRKLKEKEFEKKKKAWEKKQREEKKTLIPLVDS